jgi:hypothetical protein
MSRPTPDAASSTLGHVLERRWPTVFGIAVVAVLFVTGAIEDFADGLVVAALVYWVWGALRRELWQPSWFALETAGVLGFGAVTLAALSVDEDLGRYLLAAGWVAHTVWDVVHYRANRIVPRWWAESCAVADLLIPAALLFLL